VLIKLIAYPTYLLILGKGLNWAFILTALSAGSEEHDSQLTVSGAVFLLHSVRLNIILNKMLN